jgi:hypothetical protein
MTAPVRPNDEKAFGREAWVFVPTIASTAAPTAAELTGASTLNISLMIFEESGRPERSVSRPTKPVRVGDTIVFEQIGLESFTGGTMIFQFDSQSAAASTGKKAIEKFVAGLTGYLVRRVGDLVTGDFIATDFVDMFPCEFSAPFPTTIGDGESKVGAFASEFAITAQPIFNKAVV